MEHSTVKHFLKIMANAVILIEKATQEFKCSLLTLMGYFNENDLNTIIREIYACSHPPTAPKQKSNGFQEVVSSNY